MWVRKRIDISWADLAWGLVRAALPGGQDAAQQRLQRFWSTADDALACLSVRSGFDLWLKALALPPGSEILLSAVTVPDMARIVREHGLVPVPLDLDAATMAPNLERFEAAISPAARAVVVAHLFGGRIPMPPIHAIARRHGLLVVEDCAQVFDGVYRGHRDSDVSMFSFGPIKTATALGGGLLRVRDPQVRQQMRTLQAEYPVQKRRALFSRLCKYAVLKALCTRWVFGGIIGTYRRLGWEYDRMVNGRVRGFAGAEFFQMIRQQPSAPLLALLERRLARYPAERLGRRGAKGRELLRRLSPVVPCPSAALVPHSHWVFAILPDDPQEAIAALSRAGFDATQGQSMRVVDPPADRPHLAATASLDIMQRLVFIPIYPEMTDRALARMADVLIGLAAEATGPRPAAPQRRSEGVKVSAPHAASGVAGRLRLGRPQP